MQKQDETERKCRREVVERYCPVIDENTVLIRRSYENGTICECVHHDKCKGRDGCRHQNVMR